MGYQDYFTYQMSEIDCGVCGKTFKPIPQVSCGVEKCPCPAISAQLVRALAKSAQVVGSGATR